MPTAPRKCCSCRGCTSCEGRCPELTTGGKCPACLSQSRRGQRKNDHVYSSPRWKALRRQVRREQPFCAIEGCISPTHDVDHIQPVETHPHLAYVRSNCQGLCKSHHSAKTAKEVLHRD